MHTPQTIAKQNELIAKADRELATARQLRAIRNAEERVQVGYITDDIGRRTVAQFDFMDAALGQERR